LFISYFCSNYVLVLQDNGKNGKKPGLQNSPCLFDGVKGLVQEGRIVPQQMIYFIYDREGKINMLNVPSARNIFNE
jgi:hypothetical protein